MKGKIFMGALASLSLFLIASACDIGLGGAVDTEIPTGTISSPGVNAVIRDAFAIKGTWKDDGSVGQVTVALSNTNTKTTRTYNAKVAADGTWICAVDPADSAQPLVDGTYLATVTLYDNGGHTNTVTQSYIIDNTPPVVILSYLKSKDDSATEIKTYGKLFTLSGKAADDNNINRIDVKVYQDEACSTELRTITKLNVPAAIEQDVASFGTEEYSAIYGQNSTNSQVRYCKVFAYDDAQRYPADGSAQTDSDKLGNCQTSYYFQTTIEKLGYDKYKTNDLYAMFNGTYSNGSQDSSRVVLSSDEISTVKKTLTETAVKVGTFALNPKNNPTFTVIGLNQALPEGETMFDSATSEPKTLYTVTNGDTQSGIPLTITLTPGRDNYAIENSSIKMYLQECSVTGEVISTAEKITIPNENNSTSIKTKPISTQNFAGLKTDKYYKVCVEGTDTKENAVEPDIDGIYAFYLAPLNGVIELNVSASPEYVSTDDNANAVNKKLNVSLKFSYTGTEKLYWYREFDSAPGENAAAKGEISDTGVDKTFTDVINVSELAGKSSVYYVLKNESGSSYSRPRNINIKFDNSKPEITSIKYPEAKDTSENSFRFEGTVSDNGSGINSIIVTLSDVNNPDKKYETTLAGTENWSLTIIRTSKFKDEENPAYGGVFAKDGKKKISVQAVDGVGLKSEKTNLSEKEFDYKATTPSLKLNKYNLYKSDTLSEAKAVDYDLMSANANINIGNYDKYEFELETTDEYGINSINCTREPSPAAARPLNVEALNSEKTLWRITESDLPENGKTAEYKYSITITDKAGIQYNKTNILKISIDRKPPEIKEITLPGTKSFGDDSLKGSAYNIKGTAVDESPSIGMKAVRYAIKKTGETISSADWENATLNGENWSIIKPLGTGTSGTDDTAVYEGNYTLHVKAIDNADNESAVITRNFCVDQNPPAVSVEVYVKDSTGTETHDGSNDKYKKLSEQNSYSIQDDFYFVVNATDTNGIKAVTPTVKLAGTAKTVNLVRNGNIWTSDIIKEVGTYSISVEAEDISGDETLSLKGKTASKDFAVLFDNTEPELEILKAGTKNVDNTASSANCWVLGTGTFKITGSSRDLQSGLDTVKIKIDSNEFEEVSVNAVDNTWAYSKTPSELSLSENTNETNSLHKITLVAKNKVGLETTKEAYFRYDKVTPTVTISADNAYLGSQTYSKTNKVTLSGRAYDTLETWRPVKQVLLTASATAPDGSVIDLTSKAEGSVMKKLSAGIPVTLSTSQNNDFGKFLYEISSTDLDDGKYTFTVTATDYAGQSDIRTAMVIVDKQAPSIVSESSSIQNVSFSNVFAKWFNSTNLKLAITAADNTNGSGLESVEYSTSNTENSWNNLKKTGTTWTGTVTEGLSDTSDTVINKLYFRATDMAGNVIVYGANGTIVNIDTSPANLESLFYKVGEGNIITAGGTAYVNGSKPITIYGQYDDKNSGVRDTDLSFTLGTTAITPNEITYSETEITRDASGTATKSWISTAEADNSAKPFKTLSDFTDKTKIRSWKAIYTPTTGGKLTVSGGNGAGTSSNANVFTISFDTIAPKIDNISLATSSKTNKVYEQDDTTYWVNNSSDSPTFTFAGIATDNTSVESVILNIGGSLGTDGVTITGGQDYNIDTANDVTVSQWKFSGKSLAGTESTTAILKATDIAGNEFAKSLTIKFDNAAPAGVHAIDTEGKDLYFRIGDNNNDDLSTTDSGWNKANTEKDTAGNTIKVDEDVGGKYSTNTYGNARNIVIRGKFDDNSGCGVNKIYYYIASSKSGAETVTKDTYKTFTSNYFTPIVQTSSESVEQQSKRRVFYTDSKNSGKLHNSTDNTQTEYWNKEISSPTPVDASKNRYSAIIDSSFKAEISGFTPNTPNYLVLIAVDNVGNAYVDTMKVVTKEENETQESLKSYSNYLINVDTTVPELTSAFESQTIYSNGTTINGQDSIEITGTVTDKPDGACAGFNYKKNDVVVLTLKVGSTETTINATLGEAAKDKDSQNKISSTWSAVIPASLFASASGNITVYGTAKDCAGSGNSTTPASMATITVDRVAPTVTITAPTDKDTNTADVQVNGKIDLTGKITNEQYLTEDAANSAGTMVLYYTINGTLGAKTGAALKTSSDYVDAVSKEVGADTNWVKFGTAKHGTSWEFTDINTRQLKLKEKSTSTEANPAYEYIADGKTLYFTVTASDKAGNIGYANPQKVIIDQDTDRPIITFSNITLKDIDANTAMTSTSRVWAKADTIYGSVYDDDGIDSVYVIESDTKPSAADWNDTNKAKSAYSSGALEYPVTNGKKTLWFKVKDGEGGEFISSSETSPSNDVILASPKLKDKVTNDNEKENYYGYKNGHGITEGSGKNILTTTVYVQVDTKDPEIYQTVWYTFDKTLVDELKNANETSRKEILDKPETHSWNVISSLGGEYIGGEKKKKIYIMYKAQDASGILSSTESFGGVSGTKEFPVTQTSPYTTEENVYYAQVVSFDLSTVQSGNSVNMVLRVTDRANRSYEGNYYFSVDNEAPSIEIKKYADDDSVFGSSSVSITGNTTEKRSQIDKLYFAVTKIKDDGTPEEPKDDVVNANGEVTTKGDWVDFTNYVSKAIWTIAFDKDSIKFNKEDGTIYYTEFLNDKLKSLYGDNIITSVDSKKLCIWFYATDSLGNSGKEDAQKLILNVITQADIPSVAIEYPETTTTEKTTTVSSTIRLSGSTDIKDSKRHVKAVWIQIDPDYDASTGFSSSWKTSLEKKVGTQSVGYKIITSDTKVTEEIKVVPPASVGSGILATMSSQTSWNLTVNTLNELLNETTSTGEGGTETKIKVSTVVAVRAYAVSDNDKVSSPSIVYFTIDPNAPHFAGYDGKENSYILVNAADSNKKMKYTSGMWISGKWLLKGSVSHSAGIKTLTAGTTALVSDGSAITFANGTLIESYTAANGDKGWKFTIPVGTGFARQNFDVVAVDNSTSANNSKLSVSLQYDDTAPANFAAIDLNASANTFVQADGTLSLTGTVDESGSGLARNAFYFTRDYTVSGTTTRWFIDPMLAKNSNNATDNKGNFVELGTVTKDETGKETFTPKTNSGIVYNEADGLYWRTSEGATISSNVLTVTSLPENVRTGGLCKINNVIYRMEEVSGTSIKIDSDHEVEDTATGTTTTVYFALAQVIDNLKGEGGKTKIYGEAWEALSADDGDWMVEKITLNGSTYTWTGSINSKNILDGNVDLHFSYFDNAGNVGTKSYSGMVCNNAPRLAGVTIATDYNGDGKYDKEGEKKSYWLGSSFTASDGKYATRVTDIKDNKITVAGADNSAFKTVKGDTEIRAEIIGGNGTLSYTYNIGTTLGASTNISGSGNDLTLETKDAEGNDIVFPSYDTTSANAYMMNGDYIKSRTATIKVPLAYFDNYGNVANATNRKIENSTTSSPTWFQYVIWDETDGLVAGSTSQHATMNIALAVQVHDSSEPTAAISPFYWNSLNDNSIYDSKNTKQIAGFDEEGENGKWIGLKGHIELPADLNATIFNAASGLYDKDPKVSGKIVVRGTAYDNIRLNKLYVQFDDHSGIGSKTLAATYASGKWTSEKTTLDDGGWAFSVEDGTYDENGHNANWKLTIDTEKLSTITGLDKAIKIIAKDERGAKESTTGGLESLETDDTSYQVDVVPYITAIQTHERNSSGLKNQNIRSTSGKYSILANKAADKITVKGFNFDKDNISARIVASNAVNSSTVPTGTSLTIDASDVNTATITNSGITKSGYLELFSRNVRALNNVNTNNAYGTAKKTISGVETKINATNATVTDYASAYNREADYNNTKNVQLTDDRYIRFFDMKDTGIKNAYYPVMMMGMEADSTDNTKLITTDNPVFGYVDLNGMNSTSIFNCYASNKAQYMVQRAEFDADTGKTSDIEYLIGGMTWDQMAMSRDNQGKYMHVSSLNQNNSYMSFVYDRYAEITAYRYYNNGWKNRYDGWGRGSHWSDWIDILKDEYTTNGKYTYAEETGNNAITIEGTGYGNGTLVGRYQGMKMHTRGDSTTASGAINYLAYYDDNTTNNDIIFRTFKVRTKANDSLGNAMTGNLSSNLTEGDTSGRITAASNATKYLDLGVTSDGHAVIVYYDKSGKLKMVHSKAAVTGAITGTEFEASSNFNVTAYIGQYVSMAIDGDDHIHIAAFDSGKSVLRYIYMADYNSAPVTYTVDASTSVGKWTQIKVHNGKPYIGYYNNAEDGQPESIKLAYLAADTVSDGYANGYTTGNWEYMTVPSLTPAQGGDAKFQAVCLDFDSTGRPVVGYLGTNLEFGKWLSE